MSDERRTIDIGYLAHPYGQRHTNVGPSFKIDIGGATTLTIDRQSAGWQPSITWVNTYGNVTSAKHHYRLSEQAAEMAEGILSRIERDSK